MAARFSGGCRCGAVRYDGSEEPQVAAYCHCRDCQLSVGGAFAVILLVSKSAFSLQGELKGYAVKGASGGTVTRKFCPECGTPVLSEISANPGVVALKAGTLDDASWVRPIVEVWTETAQPWARIPAEISSFPKNPPS